MLLKEFKFIFSELRSPFFLVFYYFIFECARNIVQKQPFTPAPDKSLTIYKRAEVDFLQNETFIAAQSFDFSLVIIPKCGKKD